MQPPCMWRKFLHVVGNGLLWYRFRFTSTRAHEVPLHSTSRAHILTASLCGANRCVGVPPPTPPLMGIRHHLFQPSALRSCHVAADTVIQDTPPAFSSPKILVSLWNHLSLHQSRPRSQPTESQLCQRITLEGSKTPLISYLTTGFSPCGRKGAGAVKHHHGQGKRK